MGVQKVIDSALQKARLALWAGSPSVAQYNKGPDLVAGDYLESLANAGRAGNVLPLIGRDTSDRLRIGGAYHNPLGTPILCMISAAAKIAVAQAIFVNANDAEALEISRIDCIYGTADGAANTAKITKEGLGVAPGSGDSVMSGTFDLNTTTNTLQTATLVGVPGNASRNNTISGTSKLLISAGEQLSVKITSALTSLASLSIIVWVRESVALPPASLFLAANGDIATMTMYLNVIPGTTVRAVAMRWSAAGTNGGTVTADITKDVSTNAPGAGTSILAAALSVKTTANTTMFPALAATAATLKMAASDRLALKMTGTLTALAGLVVTVFFNSGTEKLLVLPLNHWDAVATDRTLFIADRYYEVYDNWATWSVASTSNDHNLTKDTGTTAPGAGTGLLTDNSAAGILTSSTANTPVSSVLLTAVSTKPSLILAPGDRLGQKNAVTTGSLAGYASAVVLKAI